MSPSWDFEALGLSQNIANEFLQSASVQQALVSHRHEKWVHEISEASLTTLDLCGATKDVLLQMKSRVEALRTRNKRQGLGALQKPHKTAEHGIIITKLKNQILKCLKSLRGIKDKPMAGDIETECRDSMLLVVGMLRDVRLACTLVLEWLLSSVSEDRKSQSWSLRSMLMCGQGQRKIMSEEVAMEAAGDKRVEAIGSAISELENTFRRLIQTRVSLLNIVTSSSTTFSYSKL